MAVLTQLLCLSRRNGVGHWQQTVKVANSKKSYNLLQAKKTLCKAKKFLTKRSLVPNEKRKMENMRDFSFRVKLKICFETEILFDFIFKSL